MSNYILIRCDPYSQFCGTTFLAGDRFHGARLVIAYIKEESKESSNSFSFSLQDPEDYSIHHFRVNLLPNFPYPKIDAY